MNRRCNYCLWRKLSRGCSDAELDDYLSKYSVYSIVNATQKYKRDFTKEPRIFKYDEVYNYFMIVIWLEDNCPLIFRINDEYEIIAEVLDYNLEFK